MSIFPNFSRSCCVLLSFLHDSISSHFFPLCARSFLSRLLSIPKINTLRIIKHEITLIINIRGLEETARERERERLFSNGEWQFFILLLSPLQPVGKFQNLIFQYTHSRKQLGCMLYFRQFLFDGVNVLQESKKRRPNRGESELKRNS